MADVANPMGRALAAYYFEVEPALWADLDACGALASALPAQARAEWECLALHACVRGMVAAAGFGDATADAIDAMHEIVLEKWTSGPGEATFSARRARLTERYAEYGRIGQELESDGVEVIAAALSTAAAAHVFAPSAPPEGAASMLADLHAAMTDGATEVARRLTVAGA